MVKQRKKYTYFIGVDISKHKLDFAVMRRNRLLFHCERQNNPQDIRAFMNELNGLSGFDLAGTIFCMENTGFYDKHLRNCILAQNGNCYAGNALHVKLSMGIKREKTDKTDAIRIAKFAWKNREELRFESVKRPVMLQLAAMNSLRTRLIGLKLIVQGALQEQAPFTDGEIQKMAVSKCQRSSDAIAGDLAELEITINQLIASDSHLNRLLQLIMSVPGVGRVTASHILIATNEFISINKAKKFACYSGIAPFVRESGTGTDRSRARISHIANKKMKALLHICALIAIRRNESIKQYYTRKNVVEKKPKLSAINAVRNKLVRIIFACVRKNELYSGLYVHEWPDWPRQNLSSKNRQGGIGQAHETNREGDQCAGEPARVVE